MCHQCGRPIPTRRKFCSTECYHANDHDRSIARFWGKARKTESCWVWTGKIHYRGYGVQPNRRGETYAHRLAWTLVNGPIPEGMIVMHKCDNPPCVRPDHLMLGTKGENSFDMKRKGRARGSYLGGRRNPAAKLTPEQVAEIRARVGGYGTGRPLAREFGVSPSTITAIKAGRLWKDVA
jgi:hypothetical protein